jgi:hypothetical protein
MSDEKNTRRAIENVAQRIQTEHKKQGRSITYTDAQRQARTIAVNYKRKQQ